MTPRTEVFDGRAHKVFPAVLAVEGVMNEAFVSGDELAKSAPAWNGRAVPLLHPEQLGEPISAAASPEVLERRVGTIFNAEMRDGRLKAELWIDEAKMDELGAGDVLEQMSSGEIVEVSTGYFSDDVLEPGDFNGVPYKVKHTNIRPDHLALLPGQIGACSVADGCGVPRINLSMMEDPMTTLRNQAHTNHGVHAATCSCATCVAKRNADDDDKPIEMTRGELEQLISDSVDKAVAAELARRRGEGSDEGEVYDAAGNPRVPNAQALADLTNAEPIHVLVERRIAARASGRGTVLSTGHDSRGAYELVKSNGGFVKRRPSRHADTADSTFVADDMPVRETVERRLAARAQARARRGAA